MKMGKLTGVAGPFLTPFVDKFLLESPTRTLLVSLFTCWSKRRLRNWRVRWDIVLSSISLFDVTPTLSSTTGVGKNCCQICVDLRNPTALQQLQYTTIRTIQQSRQPCWPGQPTKYDVKTGVPCGISHFQPYLHVNTVGSALEQLET